MTRSELVLAILSASEGRPYTPVQMQKAAFLIDQNMPGIVTDGPSFHFVPYDYGPFDSAVYTEAETLQKRGHAVVAPSGTGRWNTYAASDEGYREGSEILNTLTPEQATYIREVSSWVRSLPFSRLVKSIYDAYPEMRANSIFRG